MSLRSPAAEAELLDRTWWRWRRHQAIRRRPRPWLRAGCRRLCYDMA